ncbi:translocation/assembly module TamB domain-containing protein [Formosa haliotis]|uniref:translocation/assembly module TamB domain-containing protein n=1 Tax=Formosa haliotis TaxID=1555194 RepID=UPI0008259101|nr:translocation/assembly module TamB [Formosa haliotis]
MEEKKELKNKPTKKLKVLKILRNIVIVLFVLFLLLVLVIRSPWGQNLIVNYATSFVSNKTHTTVDIEKLFVTFGGDIKLNGLYLEDTKGDTLIYSKSVKADIPLWPLITGSGFDLDNLDWEGLRANIIRKDSIAGYNFQFLIDAFASADTLQTETVPEPDAKPFKINIGDIHLKDIDLVFNDAVLGIESYYKVGELELDMKTFDLDAMNFRASDAKIIDSDISFIQTPVPPSKDTTATTLPYISVDDFIIENTKAHYASSELGINLRTNISSFYAEDGEFDVLNSSFSIEEIGLKDSEIVYQSTTQAKEEQVSSSSSSSSIEWPEIQLKVDQIDFENNAVQYTVNNAKPLKNKFNGDAIVLDDFTLQANDFYLKDKTAGLHLETLHFNEGSGLNISKGEFTAEATDQFLKLSGIDIALNKNHVKGDTRLDYSTISALAKSPETSKLELSFPVLQLDINDVFRFQPDLKANPYVDSLSQRLITGHLHATGYLSEIAVKNTALNWGKTTSISASGLIKNATDVDNLTLDINPIKAQSIKADVLHFVNEKDLGVNLPEEIALSGTLKGTLNNISTQAELTTSQGVAELTGSYNGENGLDFTSDIEIKDFKLNEFLQNESLGPISISLKANGSGKTMNDLDANLDAVISSFKLKNYEIVDLPITGELVNGKGHVSSTYKDKNINVDLQSDIVLDSIAPEIIADLDVIGVDLQALGVVQKDIRAGLKLHADFKGNADAFDVTSTVDNGTIVFNKNTYLLGDINADAHVTKDTTALNITNKLLSLKLESNANPQTFSAALKNHVLSYFYLDSTQVIPTKPVQLKLTGKLSEAPVLNDVFLPNLKNIDTVDIAVNFNESDKILNANIVAPLINYSGNEIDSLAFSLDTDPDKFVFNLGFKEISAGPILIKKTNISGNQLDNEMDLTMVAYDGDEVLMQMKSKISGEESGVRFHILPEEFIVNRENWQVPDDNAFTYSKHILGFKNFNFSKNEQHIAIANSRDDQAKKDNITLDFENFKLNEFLAYLNPDKELARGDLSGDFTVQNPFENIGYLADLNITNFNILDTNFGTLTLNGNSESSSKYTFNLATKEGDVDLDMNGDYFASQTNPRIEAELTINEFKMTALQGLSLGEVSDASGAFTGHFIIKGSPSDPQYNGELVFHDSKFKATKLNSGFTLSDETLAIDNSGIRLNNFTIRDEDQSTFVLNGLVGTEDFANPTFDLTINADDFQVLNATKEENDIIYGFLSFNAQGTIKGDLNIPVIDINADVNPKTDVTYVMPSAAVNIEERDGVVIFVNRDNPDAILTRNQEEASEVTGFDVKANFSISNEAKVTLILDENSGDNFETSGEGDFVFRMDPNGRMNLSGVYTVSSGHYEMSLYELVTRRFELVSGSRVSWSGNPFDADLDVKALYNVKASSLPLMASQISGSDPAVKSKYKQTLPFEVYLNIDGELMHPKISFNLDMPEDDQGAIGGQVYGRVQQVNEEEGELNRQVFSLLVMGRFYPEAGSDGSSGGFVSMARDNLNDAISDQLNMFSDKLLGSTGLELDFGLNSFTDYQGDSPEQRTQLNVAAQKKLFHDRVIVRVGSEVDIEGSGSSSQDTPFIGDVSLEYLITPTGKYRLQAFQKNQFESVIDGQTVVSGLALIFTQEFNKFKELWRAMFHSDEEKAENKRLLQKEKEEEKAQKKLLKKKKRNLVNKYIEEHF